MTTNRIIWLIAKSRVSRKRYWQAFFAILATWVVIVGTHPFVPGATITVNAALVVTLIIWLPIAAARCRDMGHRGIWALTNLLPLAPIFIIINGTGRSVPPTTSAADDHSAEETNDRASPPTMPAHPNHTDHDYPPPIKHTHSLSNRKAFLAGILCALVIAGAAIAAVLFFMNDEPEPKQALSPALPTPTPSPTTTPTQPPTATFVPTRAPTFTPWPTPTNAPHPTPTPTLVPTSAPLPTPDIRASLIAAYASCNGQYAGQELEGRAAAAQATLDRGYRTVDELRQIVVENCQSGAADLPPATIPTEADQFPVHVYIEAYASCNGLHSGPTKDRRYQTIQAAIDSGYQTIDALKAIIDNRCPSADHAAASVPQATPTPLPTTNQSFAALYQSWGQALSEDRGHSLKWADGSNWHDGRSRSLPELPLDPNQPWFAQITCAQHEALSMTAFPDDYDIYTWHEHPNADHITALWEAQIAATFWGNIPEAPALQAANPFGDYCGLLMQ